MLSASRLLHASLVDYDVAVSAGTIFLVVTWSGVKFRILFLFIKGRSESVVERQGTRLDLLSGFLHNGKATVVVIDVSISATTVWMVNDPSVVYACVIDALKFLLRTDLVCELDSRSVDCTLRVAEWLEGTESRAHFYL